MEFYEKYGIKPLINASETYTNLGGSLMDSRTIEAMKEAGNGFVDLEELLDKVCNKAAKLTNNEGAFITTGAAGGVILTAAASIIMANAKDKAYEALLDIFPNLSSMQRNEILVFDGKFLDSIPYWKLIKLTGAKIIKVKPDEDSIRAAINEKTAAFFLFPSTLYETGIMTCEEAIPIIKEMNTTVIVDAAAQLPPKENLWYYTTKLGADAVIFSGGKHLKGPQCTGLIAGKKEITTLCRKLASPNARIGRAFKTGKEELAGFITALEIFVKTDTEDRFKQQEAILSYVSETLKKKTGLSTVLQNRGRLGTYQPLLIGLLPEGLTAAECNEYARKCEVPVDLGVYQTEFKKPDNMFFINAYNLQPFEAEAVINAIAGFLNLKGK